MRIKNKYRKSGAVSRVVSKLRICANILVTALSIAICVLSVVNAEEAPTPPKQLDNMVASTPQERALMNSSVNCLPKKALDALSAGARPDVSLLPKHPTALAFAIRNGCFDIVDMLITSGADVTAIDADGHSYLHIATWPGTKLTPQIAELLLRNGADPNVIHCSTGKHPQRSALDNARLLKHSVNMNVRDATVAVLSSHGAKSAIDGEIQVECSQPRSDKPN